MDKRKKQKIIGDRFRRWWEESGKSRAAFSDDIGLKERSTTKYCSPGEHFIFVDRFNAMAEAAGMTVDELRQKIGVPAATENVRGPIAAMREIPVFHGMSAVQRDLREAVEVDRISLPNYRDAEFGVVVDGACMEPEYPDGTVVLFRSEDQSRREGLLAHGDYLIWFASGETTFKQVASVDGKKNVILRCRNEDKESYPDLPVKRKDITGWARVAWRLLPPPR